VRAVGREGQSEGSLEELAAGKFVTSLRASTSHKRSPPKTVAKSQPFCCLVKKVMLPGRSQKFVKSGGEGGGDLLCGQIPKQTGWPSASFMVAVASQRPLDEAAAPMTSPHAAAGRFDAGFQIPQANKFVRPAEKTVFPSANRPSAEAPLVFRPG